MVTLLLGICMLAFSVVLRLAHKLRLTIPLLYLLIVPTFLRRWYLTHILLAEGVFCALLAAVMISWLISLWRIVSDAIEERTADSAAVGRFAERVRSARARGESVVSTEGLW